jgi:Tfp pilus assembly protein FimT
MRTTSATGNNSRRRDGGFTLVEIGAAIFVIALVMAMAVPQFVRSYNASALNAATRAYVTTCQLARLQAVLHQTTVTLKLDLDEHRFWLRYLQQSADGESEERPSDLTKLDGRVAIYAAELQGETAIQKGEMDVKFYPNGTCDPVTVWFRGTEKGAGTAVVLEAITARATTYTVKL